MFTVRATVAGVDRDHTFEWCHEAWEYFGLCVSNGGMLMRDCVEEGDNFPVIRVRLAYMIDSTAAEVEYANVVMV